MAHNIARLNGTDQAWYADKPAWHNLGTVTAGARTAREVVKAVPAFQQPVILVPAGAKIGNRWVEDPDKRATVRRGTDTIMGYVSLEYEKLTDEDACRTLEAVITEAGRKAKAGFVTAGLLGAKGARGFASIDLTLVFGDKLKVKRDPSRQESHLFGDWTHDGSGAMHCGLWNNRVECNNMLDMANGYASRHGLLARILHKGDMRAQMQEARRILSLVEVTGTAHAELMNALAAIPLAKPSRWIRDFTEVLVPHPAPEEGGKRMVANRDETRRLIRELFDHSKTLTGVPMSPYRGLQAVAEYADHVRPLRISGEATLEQAADRRFRGITEGGPADLKAKALELIRQEFEVPVYTPMAAAARS